MTEKKQDDRFVFRIIYKKIIMRASFITAIFILLSLSITAGLIYQSKKLQVDAGQAASFGIAPPFLHFNGLKPGEKAKASVRVLRGDHEGAQEVSAYFDGLEVAEWITMPSSIRLAEGQNEAVYEFEIQIPATAKKGSYDGYLYLALGSEKRKSGVGIALGGRAEVRVSVVETDEEAAEARRTSSFARARGPLAERLEGAFVMRVEARGELYYIAPRTKLMYPLRSQAEFEALARAEARAIEDQLLLKVPIRNKPSNSLDPVFASSLAGNLLRPAARSAEIWYVSLGEAERSQIWPSPDILPALARLSIGLSEENYRKLVK
jgi:hypothetical protein